MTKESTMKNPKPEPVVVTTICSLCGENWQAHGADPTTLDCIRLLKAKPYPITVYRPTYVQPYVVPNWYPSTTTPTFPGTTYGVTATAVSLNEAHMTQAINSADRSRAA